MTEQRKNLYYYKRRPDAIDWYRHGGVVRELPGVELVNETDFKWHHIPKYGDALLINRGFSEDMINRMIMARNANVRTILDIDDDLFNLPPYNATTWKPNVMQLIDKHMTALQVADRVICSTVFLKQTLRKVLGEYQTEYLKSINKDAAYIRREMKLINRKFFVVRNAFNDYQLRLDNCVPRSSSPDRSKPMILWRGSDTHQEDVGHVKEAIESVGKAVRWRFKGWNPYILDRAKTGHQWEIFDQDLYSYFHSIVSLRPEFVFVPLMDNKFNRAKSNIAWIEATYCGAVTIAPTLPEWQQPGVLNYENPEHCRKLLKVAAVMPAEERIKRVEESREAIRKNYLLSDLNKRRFDILFSKEV